MEEQVCVCAAVFCKLPASSLGGHKSGEQKVCVSKSSFCRNGLCHREAWSPLAYPGIAGLPGSWLGLPVPSRDCPGVFTLLQALVHFRDKLS